MSKSLQPPWTVAHQAPLSMGFSRQEHWSGLPCTPLGDLPNPGIEPASHASPDCRQIIYHWATREFWYTWQVYLINKYLTTSYQYTHIHISCCFLHNLNTMWRKTETTVLSFIWLLENSSLRVWVSYIESFTTNDYIYFLGSRFLCTVL